MSIILRVARRAGVLAAVLLGLLPPTAAAQSYGVKAGVALSGIQFDDAYAEGSSSKVGFVGGGYVGYDLPWRFRLRAEALFAQEGATVNEVQHDRFHYVDVPILIGYGIGSRLNVSAGVMPRWLLSAEETIAGETFSIKDGVEHRDLAVAFGVDYQLWRNLAFDVRYLWGRDGVYRRLNASSQGVWRTWQVTATYAFRR